MKRSIVTPFFAVFIVIALLLGAFVAFFLTANQVDLILEKTVSDTARDGLVLREWVQEQFSQGISPAQLDTKTFNQKVSSTRIESLIIADEFGFLLSDNEKRVSEEDVQNIHIAITRNAFKGELFHYLILQQKNRLKLFVPMVHSGDRVILIAEIRLQDMSKNLARLMSQTAIVLAGIFIMLLILTLYSWRHIIHPLIKMRKAVGNISRGLFEVDLDLRRRDEMGELSRSIAQMAYAVKDIEADARSSNPLTGLPGNTRIEYWIREKLLAGEKFCVIYADLDHFKPFNDLYSFSEGDKMILLAAETIRDAVFENATDLSFLGHQGGDDFIAVCPVSQWESICKKIIRQFDKKVLSLYQEEVRTMGYIDAKNRKGEQTRYPVTSISLAAVSNSQRSFNSYAEIASVASEVKKYVKRQEGSAYHLCKRRKR